MTASLAQQTYLPRYDLYTGFSDLNTPGLNNLNQVGFHLQAGLNQMRWLSSGFDYSVQNGSSQLTANLATPALQQLLAAELPRGYVLSVPYDVGIQSFTAGSQLSYRRFEKVAFFIRPSLSAFRVKAVPHPSDMVSTLVASQLVPRGSKVDWTGAYGAGGGFEYVATKHVGLRVQLDAVYNHPFNDILGSGNFSCRYSIGPAFHFRKKHTFLEEIGDR